MIQVVTRDLPGWAKAIRHLWDVRQPKHQACEVKRPMEGGISPCQAGTLRERGEKKGSARSQGRAGGENRYPHNQETLKTVRKG